MSGVAVAPAPWKLKGRSWGFMLPPWKKDVSFPSGWAMPYAADVLSTGGEFIGGIGMILIVQYSESPVGPYDELIYIPGKWKYPDGSTAARITRIYVSTKESTENGRRNWNIPKVVADFSYNRDPNTNVWDLSVRPQGSDPSTPPFFHVTVHPIPLLSSVQFSLSFSAGSFIGDYMRLCQPPVPRGETPEEIKTDKWCTLTPGTTAKARFGRAICQIGEDKKTAGDGRGYPAVVPYSIGTCLEDVTLDFGLPEWLDGF